MERIRRDRRRTEEGEGGEEKGKQMGFMGLKGNRRIGPQQHLTSFRAAAAKKKKKKQALL